MTVPVPIAQAHARLRESLPEHRGRYVPELLQLLVVVSPPVHAAGSATISRWTTLQPVCRQNPERQEIQRVNARAAINPYAVNPNA